MTKVFSSISSLIYLIPGLTRNLKGFVRFLPFRSLGKSFLESGERRFGNRQYPYTLIPGLTWNLMGFGRFLLSQERGKGKQKRGHPQGIYSVAVVHPVFLIPGLTRNLMGFGRFLLSQERGVWEQERGVRKQERGEFDSRPGKGNSSSPTPFPQITSWQLHPPHDTIIPHTHVVCMRYDNVKIPGRGQA